MRIDVYRSHQCMGVFRASSLGSAGTMLSAMYGMEGEYGIQGLVEYGRSQWSLLDEFR